MTIPQATIGCDVSKTHLDFFDPQANRMQRIANTPAAIAAFLKAQDWRGAIIVLEATGHYDRALRYGLAEKTIAFARVNPMRVRRFGEAKGQHAKTDRLDAVLLAEYGRRFAPSPDAPPCAHRDRLAALHRRRDQLVAARAAERVQAQDAWDEEILKSHQDAITFLSARIEEIERRIGEAVKKDRRLAEIDTILKSVPGVGQVTAATLLCQLPELGRLTPKTAAALAGLAPYNHDSGQMRGRRAIAGGRRRVRQALYIAAIVSIRCGSRLKPFYDRLIAAGKPFKVAIVACARKLLIILNALVRDRTTYTE